KNTIRKKLTSFTGASVVRLCRIGKPQSISRVPTIIGAPVAGIGDPDCFTHSSPILRTIFASGNAALIFLLRGAVLQRLPSQPGVLVAFAAPLRATGV